jgi:hypothetical protein
LEDLADQADERRIQVLCTQSVIAGIALDALVPVDGGPIDYRVDVNRPHGAYIGAVAAGYAFIGIDFHRSIIPEPQTRKAKEFFNIIS